MKQPSGLSRLCEEAGTLAVSYVDVEEDDEGQDVDHVLLDCEDLRAKPLTAWLNEIQQATMLLDPNTGQIQLKVMSALMCAYCNLHCKAVHGRVQHGQLRVAGGGPMGAWDAISMLGQLLDVYVFSAIHHHWLACCAHRTYFRRRPPHSQHLQALWRQVNQQGPDRTSSSRFKVRGNIGNTAGRRCGVPHIQHRLT